MSGGNLLRGGKKLGTFGGGTSLRTKKNIMVLSPSRNLNGRGGSQGKDTKEKKTLFPQIKVGNTGEKKKREMQKTTRDSLPEKNEGGLGKRTPQV